MAIGGSRNGPASLMRVVSRPKRFSGGGRSGPLTSTAPLGALSSGARVSLIRWNASNRMGAAAVRPTRPGVEAPSARPTQTATVWRPSYPTRARRGSHRTSRSCRRCAAARVSRRRRIFQDVGDVPGRDRRQHGLCRIAFECTRKDCFVTLALRWLSLTGWPPRASAA